MANRKTMMTCGVGALGLLIAACGVETATTAATRNPAFQPNLSARTGVNETVIIPPI